MISLSRTTFVDLELAVPSKGNCFRLKSQNTELESSSSTLPFLPSKDSHKMDIDDLGKSRPFYLLPCYLLSPSYCPLAPLANARTLAVDNTYQLGGSDDERERDQNAALVEQLERKQRMRRMAVPTDDKKVRERLRAYGEPITLFGEGVSLSSSTSTCGQATCLWLRGR